MYADLAKIEERGKRKKKKGLLSFMGGKESGEEAPPVHMTAAFTQEPAKPEPEPKKEEEPELESEPVTQPAWEPLKGRQLKQAQQQLIEYKKGLEKEFKSGKLSAKECRMRSKKKMVTLGLSAPEE